MGFDDDNSEVKKRCCFLTMRMKCCWKLDGLLNKKKQQEKSIENKWVKRA